MITAQTGIVSEPVAQMLSTRAYNVLTLGQGLATVGELAAFRQIANIMLGPEARDWNWSGPMWGEYGITEQRAATMHAKYGGKIWKNEQDKD